MFSLLSLVLFFVFSLLIFKLEVVQLTDYIRVPMNLGLVMTSMICLLFFLFLLD